MPIFKVEHQGEEVFGLDLLSKIGKSIYGRKDPVEVLHQEKPFQIEEDKRYYKVKLKLPFIKKDDFEIHKFGDELIIDLGSHRKSVFLPRFANFLEMKDHDFEHPLADHSFEEGVT